jgi:hypothetical protein
MSSWHIVLRATKQRGNESTTLTKRQRPAALYEGGHRYPRKSCVARAAHPEIRSGAPRMRERREERKEKEEKRRRY